MTIFLTLKNQIFGEILEKSEFFRNLHGNFFTRIHDPQISNQIDAPGLSIMRVV